MWRHLATRLAFVSLGCVIVIELIAMARLAADGWVREALPLPLRQQLMPALICLVSACGMACYCFFALRQLVGYFSASWAYGLGLGYTAWMWIAPLLGTGCGITAWLLFRGSKSALGPAIGLASLALWISSFVFAGALMLEPDRQGDGKPEEP